MGARSGGKVFVAGFGRVLQSGDMQVTYYHIKIGPVLPIVLDRFSQRI
jgi:hypothetical protein